MKRSVRGLTLLLCAAVLLWALLPLSGRRDDPPRPADASAPAIPAAEPVHLLVGLTDGGALTGCLLLDLDPTAGVTVTGIPAHARLAVGTAFTTPAALWASEAVGELSDALAKQQDFSIDNSLFVGYDACIGLLKAYGIRVTVTLREDVPIPFISGRLILPAGRCTLTPDQTAAYWRQSPDPVETVRRQADAVAAFLDGWLTPAHSDAWASLFADLANASVTDWRIDRYTRHRRTLSALADRTDPVPARVYIPAGETVGEGMRRRFEFAEPSAPVF